MGPFSSNSYKTMDYSGSNYWSGVDFSLYLENILLDDAVQISWSVMEQNAPYWGYHSYVGSRIHQGSRVLQGELTCNFQRFSYFHSVMSILKQKEEELPIDLTTTKSAGNSLLSYNPADWAPESAAEMLAAAYSDQAAMSGSQIAKLVEAIKNPGSTPIFTDVEVNRALPEVNPDSPIFLTKKKGFDLYMIAGARINNPSVVKYNSDESNYITNGTYFQDDTVKNYLPGTGMKFIGVNFTNYSQTVDDSGRPIMETLNFLALDLVPMEPIEYDIESSQESLANAVAYELLSSEYWGQGFGVE